MPSSPVKPEVGVRPLLLRPRHPIWSLTFAFALWKALLLVAVTACPGPGYDTSTSLLPYRDTDTGAGASIGVGASARLSSILKFVRWDSIYFAHVVEHGYVFEQEWAFGYGYLRFLEFLTSCMIIPIILHLRSIPEESHANSQLVFDSSAQVGKVLQFAWVGVALSHLAHYLSVLALYRLSVNVFGDRTPTQKLICFLSAVLHIISPAGAFLSAPYGEPLFSFLNISGWYLYSSSFLDDGAGKKFTREVKLLGAAVLFAVATTVRSNGILSGFLFAYDAVWQLRRVLSHGLSWDVVVRLGVIVVGGCVVALGFVLPQVVAYTTYCLPDSTARPWCQWTIPSIYGWVQEQYWNVGFLRYWTISNIPLFLLATPMLLLLWRSSLWAIKTPWIADKDRPSTKADQATSPAATESLLIRFAVPQGLLAVLALTNYHVQIINRISSGYPVWYWYLVCLVLNRVGGSPSASKSNRLFSVVVQGMVVYALIQAVLFGSFLPPA